MMVLGSMEVIESIPCLPPSRHRNWYRQSPPPFSLCLMGRFHCVPLRNATRIHARRRFEPQTARARTNGQRNCPDKSLSIDAELSSLNYQPGGIKVVDTFRGARLGLRRHGVRRRSTRSTTSHKMPNNKNGHLPYGGPNGHSDYDATGGRQIILNRKHLNSPSLAVAHTTIPRTGRLLALSPQRGS